MQIFSDVCSENSQLFSCVQKAHFPLSLNSDLEGWIMQVASIIWLAQYFCYSWFCNGNIPALKTEQ